MIEFQKVVKEFCLKGRKATKEIQKNLGATKTE